MAFLPKRPVQIQLPLGSRAQGHTGTAGARLCGFGELDPTGNPQLQSPARIGPLSLAYMGRQWKRAGKDWKGGVIDKGWAAEGLKRGKHRVRGRTGSGEVIKAC